MATEIITTITGALTGIASGLASTLVSTFNTVFVTAEGKLTEIAIFGLVFLGIGFSVSVFYIIRGMLKS